MSRNQIMKKVLPAKAQVADTVFVTGSYNHLTSLLNVSGLLCHVTLKI